MVFGLSAFGMPSTAFTPENLTQICVFKEGSKHLIIFWDLYYLSFLIRSFFRQKKMLSMTQPRLNGIDSEPETQSPVHRPAHVQRVS